MHASSTSTSSTANQKQILQIYLDVHNNQAVVTGLGEALLHSVHVMCKLSYACKVCVNWHLH